jgi:hypothetical protein
VGLASERSFKRKRANYWRWQREFLDDEGITDQVAIEAAVEEMRELLEEQEAAVRKQRIRVGKRCAFLVGSVTLGLLGGPFTPVAVGGAFLSVAQYAANRILEGGKGEGADESPAALFLDAQKHFGW